MKRWVLLGVGTFLTFLCLLLSFIIFNIGGHYVNSTLLAILNFIFQSLAIFAVAFISARAYLKSGLIQLLLIGGGIICFGTGVLINSLSPYFVQAANYANFTVTVHNIGLLIFSVFSLAAGLTLKFRPSNGEGRKTQKRLNLTLTYSILVVFIITMAALTYFSILPSFNLDGSFTPLRQTILGTALVLFSIAASVFAELYFETKTPTLYWLALGLALYAIGVVTIASIDTLNTALTWLGRVAQYAGSIFFVVALITAKDEQRWIGAFTRSKLQFEYLFKKMNEGFAYYKVLVDKENKPIDLILLEINQAYTSLTGLGPDKIGKNLSEIFPNMSDAQKWIKTFGDVGISGQPIHLEMYSTALAKWFSISAYCPQRGYFAIIFEDISNRRRAEQALAESTQLYKTIFENSQDGFQLVEVIQDKNGKPVDIKILEVNSAYERIIGVKVSDITGKTVTYISPNAEPYWFEIPYKVAKTGHTEHVDLFNRDLGKWLDCYYFPYTKNFVGTLFRDVTERKKLEKELQDNERLAAIGATAGMVGHDIRNPLQAITSDVYLAKTDLSSIPDSETKESLKESLEEINKNVEYINKIVQDLQDYARPLNPKIEESDLKQVVEGILEKNDIPQNVEIEVNIQKSDKIVKADSYYLNRILSNLVTNAIQAMPQGGKLIIQTKKDGEDVLLSVKDTGVGIPENIKDKMFTLMFTTKSKGQGFGLPVVKRMVESLGGTVTFESEVGKGTTFTVRLPPKS